jgi:5'/3'-nucleotidase SurE
MTDDTTRDGGAAAEGNGANDQPDMTRERARTERRDLDKERGEPVAGGAARGRSRALRAIAKPLGDWTGRPRILITNDDGVESRGLLALKQALDPIGETTVVAPDTNQSAVGHQKTLMRPLRVRERTLGDGSMAYSVDGSPTDAVSLAFLGYFGHGFDLVASGINYGANLGDDITYSGTVAAALEGILLGLPAIALSQQSAAREMDFRLGEEFSFDEGARFVARVVEEIQRVPLPPGTLLNVNAPAGRAGPTGMQPADRRSGRTPALPYPPAGEAGDSAKGPRRPAQNHPWRRPFKRQE